MKNKKCVFFDMDGVLIQSTIYTFYSFKEYLSLYGVIISFEQRNKYQGLGLREKIQRWNSEFSISINQADMYKQTLASQKKYISQYHIEKDLFYFLYKLRDHNIEATVVTSSNRERTFHILNSLGIEHLFHKIYTQEDSSTNTKGKEDLYKRAHLESSYSKDETVIIEDSQVGINSGISVGIDVIGRKGPYQKSIDYNKCILTIKDFSDEQLLTIFPKNHENNTLQTTPRTYSGSKKYCLITKYKS